MHHYKLLSLNNFHYLHGVESNKVVKHGIQVVVVVVRDVLALHRPLVDRVVNFLDALKVHRRECEQ